MARKPKDRPFHDPKQDLLIVTGMGNNSKDGEAVIKVRAPLSRSFLPLLLWCGFVFLDGFLTFFFSVFF